MLLNLVGLLKHSMWCSLCWFETICQLLFPEVGTNQTSCVCTWQSSDNYKQPPIIWILGSFSSVWLVIQHYDPQLSQESRVLAPFFSTAKWYRNLATRVTTSNFHSKIGDESYYNCKNAVCNQTGNHVSIFVIPQNIHSGIQIKTLNEVLASSDRTLSAEI